VHRTAAVHDEDDPSSVRPDTAAHPTTRRDINALRQGGAQLWRLLDLLVEQVTPTLLHDIIRQVVNVAEADEVALFAGDSTPLLIAAHGPRVLAEQAGLVDRRLERAAGMGQIVALGGADDDTIWRADPRTAVHHGLWVPAPPGAAHRIVLRVLRTRPRPFRPGTADLLQLVTKRLASVVSQRHDQQSTNLQQVERAQLFLVSASVAQELDPGAVARRVARGLTAVTDFATATVELVDGDQVRRVAVDGDGATPGGISPLDRWRAALRDDRAIGELSYRIPADPSLPAQADDQAIAADVVTQLLDLRGNTFGFLTLAQPRTGVELSPQMVQTIELFARQAQLALANAELYDEATHQRDAARTLTRLTSALSTSLDTTAVLDTCCVAALSLSAGGRASIFLVDEHGMVRHGATAPRPDDAGQVDWSPRPLDECSLLGHAAHAGGPVLVDDLPASPFADAAVVAALDLRSAALYPLRADDTTVGFLLIDGHTAPVAFGPEEVAQLPQIANQAAVALRQAALHERTRDQADRAARLLELTTALTTTLDFAAIFKRIVEALRARLDAHAVSVLQVDAAAMRVLGTMVDGAIRCPRPPLRVPIEGNLTHAVGLVWERGTLRIDDIRDCPAWSSIATTSTRAVILAVPPDRAETDVLLTVSSTSSGAFTGDHEQFLGDLARVTQLAVRNAELFDRVSDSARRDPLTGLFNRRAFWTQLQQRLDGLRGTDTVALAVIDADDFKAINDRFGHGVGDAVLGHIAERLRATVRSHGDVFRIGGEEFTVIMPDATADQARRVMEHVSRLIRDGHGDLPALSVSAGVAVAPVNGSTADALFSEADRALLDAKRRGKDRVELRRAVA
jgi:diguanylate cyclase (GGDEF)-like protein